MMIMTLPTSSRIVPCIQRDKGIPNSHCGADWSVPICIDWTLTGRLCLGGAGYVDIFQMKVFVEQVVELF